MAISPEFGTCGRIIPSSSFLPVQRPTDMQRTEHCGLLPRDIPETAFQIESALFSPPAQDTTYALFAPLHYESGYAYPLIVWLHGRGNDERQLLRIMPQVSMRNYVAVAPRGLGGPTGGPFQ